MDLDRLGRLFQDIQSVDNLLRQNAEQELNQITSQDPSNAALMLLTVASTTSIEIPLEIRQSALLYLKRIIPLYWSAGFGSFIGPPISQKVKSEIRNGLLTIILNKNGNQKIINAVTYSIVQIAAVDFPDEWPDLLQFIYTNLLGENSTKEQIIGGLILLHDLFDDIISEEMFFYKEVGLVTINHCWDNIGNPSVDPEIRKYAAALYKVCLLQLQNPELIEQSTQANLLKIHIESVSNKIVELLEEFVFNAHNIEFKTYLLQIANTLISEFPPEFIPSNLSKKIQVQVINDLEKLVNYYINVHVNNQEDVYVTSDPNISTDQVIFNLIIEQYQILSFISIPIDESKLINFIQTTIQYAVLPNSVVESFESDFNELVTNEMDVSPDYTVRHAILDFIMEINENDYKRFTEWSLNYFFSLNQNSSTQWKLQESLEFLLFACFKREDYTLHFESNLVLKVLEKINSLIHDDSENLFVRIRSILILPYFFEIFREVINSSQFAIKIYEDLLSKQSPWSQEHLVASLLLTLITSTSFLRVNDISEDNGYSIWQIGINRLIDTLIEISEEDTPPLLAESINFSLKFGKKNSVTAIQHLMKIATIDPSNIQLIIDVQECFENLLEDIDIETYTLYLSQILNGTLDIIDNSKGLFSPLLSLNLEILSSFVERTPIDIIDGVFDRIANSISNLIIQTEDDQILQVSGDLYNSLIVHFNRKYFNLDNVLQILNKLLNPSLNDSAVLKVGSLVVSVLTRFNAQLQGTEYFSLILSATTERLLKTEHVTATENFLNVLCFMVEQDAEQTLVFLKNQESLSKVLNFWFTNFDTLNGENIQTNCKAIMKIYLSSDVGLWSISVDGDEVVGFDPDIIVTRSMRKKQDFQQIAVPVKIIKLLINELYNHTEDGLEDDDHSHDDSHGHHDDEEAEDEIIEQLEDDEGWEDVEDVGFDKLQKYINEGGPSADSDPNPELKYLLIRFFKDIASRNVLNFKQIYEEVITEEERSILTKNIV